MTDVAPSEAAAPTAEVNPARGRQDRAEATKSQRRRRRAGTINRMAAYKLDIFDPKTLDLENYVYRWVNEEGGRLHEATKMDDYDFVDGSEIEGYDSSETDSESDTRVRKFVQKDAQGHPIYSFLVRKPREFFNEDMDRAVGFREDMMEGIVHNAEGFDEDALLGDDSGRITDLAEGERPNFYVPKSEGVKLGSAAARRRTGPVSPHKSKSK